MEQVVCCLKMSKLCVANLYYQTIRCFSSNLAAGWEGRNMFALGSSPVWSTPDLSQSGADIKQTRSENTDYESEFFTFHPLWSALSLGQPWRLGWPKTCRQNLVPKIGRLRSTGRWKTDNGGLVLALVVAPPPTIVPATRLWEGSSLRRRRGLHFVLA